LNVNIARLLPAAGVALVFLTLCDTLLGPVLFPDGTALFAEYRRAEPVFAFRLLGWLVTSALLAWVFPIGYRGGVAWAEGLRFGMLMGVLAGLPGVLHTYADLDVGFPVLLTAVLWQVITWGIAGALVGTVYRPALASSRK
jgi:hypothetical protein